MDDRSAELSLDIVTDNGDSALAEPLRPGRIAGDEYRDAIDERDAGFERAFGVELGSLLAAAREIVDQYVGARFLEHAHDIRLLGLRFVGEHEGAVVGIVTHVIGNTVE